MANFKQVEFTTKSGTVYTFQHPGVRPMTKIIDRVKNKYGVASDEKLGDEMLQWVIVKPKMKMEAFTDYKEYVEVISKAWAFAQGEEIEEDEEDGEAAEG